MASGDSGDSPSNAAIAAMEGGGRGGNGQEVFYLSSTVGKPPLGASYFLHIVNV